MRLLMAAVVMMSSSFILSSCSETDIDDNEYEDWQERNDTYFNSIYSQAETAIKNGDNSWKIIRGMSKNPETKNTYDHIVVKVINESNSCDSVNYSDSVRVHYRGRLMPTVAHPDGYQFDSSWSGDYNLQLMTPYQAVAKSFISGFTTALTEMAVGDRWLVYIPYQMGYGENDYGSGSSTIPGGSTLIFDVTVVKAWE